MKNKRGIVFLVLNISVPIMIGAIIYYLFCPDVIFVQQVDAIWGHGIHVNCFNMNNILVRFIRNYFLDMIWGYALVFTLYLFIANNTAELMKIFIVSFVFSAIMEILQLASFVRGTFDIFDIVVELIAEISAVFIIKNFN